jgi:hypothetical protein
MSRWSTDPADGMTLRMMDRTGQKVLKGDRAGNRVEFPAGRALRELKREQAEIRNAATLPERRRAYRRERENAATRIAALDDGNARSHVRRRTRSTGEGAVQANRYTGRHRATKGGDQQEV